MSYLVVKELSKTYIGGYNALSYVSFSMEKGESIAVVGEVQSGKTTLAYLLSGLESVSHGSITLDGVDITAMAIKVRDIGFLPCELPLFKTKSVAENLRYPLKARRLPIDENVVHTVSAVCKLADIMDIKVKKLSVYEKVRLSLARLFVMERSLYIIDNIFNMLSLDERREVIDMIASLSKGRTVIAMIDSIDIARELATDMVALLAYNTIVDCGKLEDLAGFDSTVASVKAVKGRCAEIKCRIDNGDLILCGVGIKIKKKLFQNVFRQAVIVVPECDLDIRVDGRFGGVVTDIIDSYAYIDDGELSLRLPITAGQCAVGDELRFDCSLEEYELYDLGSERKISV